MNFLDYLESKRLRQECFFNETQRHEGTKFRKIAETLRISLNLIGKAGNEAPSLLREGWGGSPVAVGLQLGWVLNPSPQPPDCQVVEANSEGF